MEDSYIFLHSMVSFRAHPSAQDALLQITHDVLDDTIPHLTKAILAVDLTKAFDSILHDAILRKLQALQDSGRNDHTLKTLKASTQFVLQLLRHVSTHPHKGLDEADNMKVLRAFTLCRILFAIPYLKLNGPET
ncbi:hypothetical protein HPB49_019190 [Dermacentor silvarum]|uniref:Uncharacterized protein n=1 Tax=Dermacentor silvarum TaxID=543639 RepID=A0ACB8DFG6_DERSI|nr:hypothetical protein HPB49_019190 [Dermacentor silvarum]